MDDRSTAAVVRELSNGIYGLVRGEIHLARVEVTEKARDLRRHGARIGLSIVALYLGAFALLAFAVIGLGNLLGDRFWLSSLIVGLLLVVPAAFFTLFPISGKAFTHERDQERSAYRRRKPDADRPGRLRA